MENEGVAFGDLFKIICKANTLILNSQFSILNSFSGTINQKGHQSLATFLC